MHNNSHTQQPQRPRQQLQPLVATHMHCCHLIWLQQLRLVSAVQAACHPRSVARHVHPRCPAVASSRSVQWPARSSITTNNSNNTIRAQATHPVAIRA